MSPTDRTRDLTAVALRLAASSGWRNLTHAAIARDAGVSNGLVVARLGTMEQVRRTVMRAALRERCVPVVAEGLAVGDKHARRADETLRAAAAEHVRTA